MSANATKLKLEMSTVSVPETAHYVERTPLELAVLKAGKKQYDGCDHCPCCLMLLKVSLGRHPVTSLYSATTRDEELQTLVQETLKFQISSDPMHVDLSKRSLCRFHALHYKLYVHRFNIDTMIAIKTFDHEDMVLDDATMEQVLSNLPSVEKAWEKSYGQWVRDLQTHVLDLFAENVEKSFLCLKADLHQKLFAKEKQLEKRISQIQEEQDLALDEAEGRLQIQMQSEKFKRAKHQLDDYGRVYRNASSTGQPHLFQLMKTYADSERKDGERFDDDLRVAYLRKVDKAKELQDKELLVWKGKLDNHRKQQYVTVRDTTAKFHLGKQNRLQRLRDVQASEAKKVFDDFRRHMVHMRSLALRRGVNVQTTTLRPITPTICGYMLLVLKRALPTSLQPKTIMKDGVPLHDSKAGTVLAQFAAWIHESVELGHLSGRELFTLIDTRRAGRVTSTDLQQFVVRHNILLHPSILFNTVPKETPGVICMDDFLMAMRPLELEYEIAVTELLFTWRGRSRRHSGDRASGSTASKKRSDERLLVVLRQIAVHALKFLQVRDPPYDRDDDIMFFRVHNFMRQKAHLTRKVRHWDPVSELSRGKSPRALSPTDQRNGYMRTGGYGSAVPRLTIAPPGDSPSHRVVSDEHGQRYYRAEREANAIDIDRRVLLHENHGTSGPGARRTGRNVADGVVDASVIETDDVYDSPAPPEGTRGNAKVLRRTLSATGRPEQQIQTQAQARDSSSSSKKQEAKLLIRRADAYHKVAITAVFGKQENQESLRKAGSALSRSPSPGARSSRDGGSPKTARSLGHVAGAQTTSVRAGTLTPHKPMFALELHSKPNFAGVNNLGKVNQKATSFLWDPVSKTRQELAANKTASSPMMSKTVADSLRRFALDPKSQPTRLGSPKHELATKRPTSTLVRSGSTVETYAADTKGGITAELLDTDHDFGSAQEEIFKTSNGGSKSPGGGANKALKDFQQKNGELSRRHDRRSMTRNRRLSRERKSENTQKAVKRYHGQQDEAHSTASGSRPQSMVDTNSPPGSPASSFSGLRASVAQFETSVGKMGGVRGTSANAAKKRASLLHRAATLIGGVRFDDDVSHSQQPTSGGPLDADAEQGENGDADDEDKQGRGGGQNQQGGKKTGKFSFYPDERVLRFHEKQKSADVQGRARPQFTASAPRSTTDKGQKVALPTGSISSGASSSPTRMRPSAEVLGVGAGPGIEQASRKPLTAAEDVRARVERQMSSHSVSVVSHRTATPSPPGDERGTATSPQRQRFIFESLGSGRSRFLGAARAGGNSNEKRPPIMLPTNGSGLQFARTPSLLTSDDDSIAGSKGTVDRLRCAFVDRKSSLGSGNPPVLKVPSLLALRGGLETGWREN